MRIRIFVHSLAIAFTTSLAFAPLAHATLYAPGETLDPSCAPADTDCGVESVVGDGTAGQIPYYAADGNTVSATSTVFLSDGKMGIGTNDPQALLEVNGETLANSFLLTPSTIGDLHGGIAGDGWFDGSHRSTIELGLNVAQLGNRDSTYQGGMARVNSRPNMPVFSVIYQEVGHAGGGGDETFPFQITSTGKVLVGNNWNPDNDTGTGNGQDLQVYGGGYFGGNVGIGTTSPYALLSVQHAAPQTVSGELVTNGTFTGDASGWSLGDDVAYGSNQVVSNYQGNDPSLSTDFETVAGSAYVLTFTVANSNAPLYAYLSNTSGDFAADEPLQDGTYSFYFVTDYTGTETIFFDDWNYDVGDTWTLDNVSIKQVSSISPSFVVTGINGDPLLSLGGLDDVLLNTAMGKDALATNIVGANNTAFGRSTLASNTTGSGNVAIGNQALMANTTGESNIALGYGTLRANTTGDLNLGIGISTMVTNTTGTQNTAIGQNGLFRNTTGSYNTAIGAAALFNNTAANYNTAVGMFSSYYTTTGINNASLGYNALLHNVTGNNNVGVGSASLNNNQYGSRNTAIGYDALGDFNDNTDDGVGNISNNTAIGYNAGLGLLTGINNTLIGANITVANSALSNNVILADGSGNQRINVDSTGRTGIASTSPWRTLSVNGTVAFNGLTGAIGNGSICLKSTTKELVYNSGSDNCLSSLRSTKHSIVNLNLSGEALIQNLKPVSFIYNDDASSTVRYGFIAEDTADVDSHLGTYDASGNLSGVDDRAVLSIVVKAMKEVFAQLDTLTQSITTNVLTAVTGNFTHVNADDVTAKKICLGTTCISETELKEILEKESLSSTSPPPSDSDTASTTDETATSSDPIASSTPPSNQTDSFDPTTTESIPDITTSSSTNSESDIPTQPEESASSSPQS